MQAIEVCTPQVLLTPKQLRSEVQARSGRRIGRTQFWEWRKALGLEPPYSLEDAIALAVFSRWLAAGLTTEKAIAKTVETLKGQGL